jgi:hypothetical protein
MTTADLGKFATGFAEFRKLMAAMPSSDARVSVFMNVAAEAASYVSKGLDRARAADELVDIAAVYGLNDDDAVQLMIAHAFERIEQVPDDIGEQKINGHDAAALIPIVRPFPIDEKSIPIRDWVMPGLLMRKQVTVLVAPSGSGKSLLTLQLGIACARGTKWSGWIPRQKFRVLVINSEDDIDEMRRRLAAAAHRMNLDEEAQIEIRNSIGLIDSTSHKSAVVAKFDPRTKTMVGQPLLEQIIATIIAEEIDVVFVDPFAETFEGDENSNSELKWAGALWREVARRTNAAVCLVHHTKKYATGMAGDVDAARGAGALIGIARIVSTLFPMTAKEAEAMGVASGKRGHYLRYDDAKANLNIVSPFARWFRKDTVRLDNATADLPGDDVGVLVPWKPEGPSVLEEQIVAFFKRVDQGLLDDAGQPTGEFYTTEASGRAGRSNERYLAGFAQDYFKLEALSQAEALIEGWRKNKRLITGPRYKSPETRKMRARVISELNPLAPKNGQAEPAPAQEQERFL